MSYKVDHWYPCGYCERRGYVVTKDGKGGEYRQTCPKCNGDKGHGSVTWIATARKDGRGES